MRRTWMRIAVVAIVAAAVAFWVYFDKQRLQQDPEQQLDTTLNAMPAWQVLKEQEPALQKRIRDQILTMGSPAAYLQTALTPKAGFILALSSG